MQIEHCLGKMNKILDDLKKMIFMLHKISMVSLLGSQTLIEFKKF